MKYLINVDFLEFRAETSINLNLLKHSQGIYKISDALSLIYVRDYGEKERNYQYSFKLNYLKIDIGFFHAKSMSNDKPGFNTLLRINNQLFYRQDFGFILNVIIDTLELTRTIIRRLDVCIDTDEDILTRFKQLYYNPQVHFYMKQKISVNGTGPSDKYLSVGGFKSRTKYIAIYNKTQEIISSSEKQYIRNIHNKVFGIKNIYRIELRLKNKLNDIDSIEVINLGKSEYLEMIFKRYYETLIQFKDSRTNSKIDFISINYNGIIIKSSKNEKLTFGGKREKAIINFLEREYDSKEFNGQRKNLKSVISVLIKKYGLETWNKTKK